MDVDRQNLNGMERTDGMREITAELEQVGESTHFVARNRTGFEVHIDDVSAHPEGEAEGASPMELVLMGLAGCSALDVASIMRKSRCRVDSFRVQVTGLRERGAIPSPYRGMHMHFELNGDMLKVRVERAVRLSVTRYCSAAATLQYAGPITASYSVNGERFETDIRLGPDS